MENESLKNNFEGLKQTIKGYLSDTSEETLRLVSEGMDIIYKAFEDDKVPTEIQNVDLTLWIPAIWAKLRGSVDVNDFLNYFIGSNFELDSELCRLIADGIKYNHGK